MNTLTNTDLDRLQALLDNGRIFEMYQEIGAAGHKYPYLALGVVVGNSNAGVIATNYMIQVAARYGVVMTAERIEQVKLEMARGYLSTLRAIAAKDGNVTREMEWSEALDFHNKVFQSLGLPKECWTLYVPFTVQSSQDAAQNWESMLNLARSASTAEAFSGALGSYATNTLDTMSESLLLSFDPMKALTLGDSAYRWMWFGTVATGAATALPSIIGSLLPNGQTPALRRQIFELQGLINLVSGGEGAIVSRDNLITQSKGFFAQFNTQQLNSMRIRPLTTFGNVSDWIRVANSDTSDGLAVRAALIYQSPIVLYSDEINGRHSLNLYVDATGEGYVTQQFLKDRAAMLSWVIQARQHGTDNFPSPDNRFWFFDDRTTATTVGLVPESGSASIPNHVIFGRENSDQFAGQDFADFLYGRNGNDTISGNGGDDYLEGAGGDDELSGGANNDTLLGMSGNDRLFGEDGNDKLYGSTGDDQLSGNSGNDSLYGGIGKDNLDGGEDDDLVEGGADADILYGSDGNDTLRGESGTDILNGGKGADVLEGGVDDDWIQGGKGEDILQGGLGDDRYVFSKGDGVDLILDDDHAGRIIMDDQPLSGGAQVTEMPHVYLSEDRKTRYVWEPKEDGKGALMIFREGNHLLIEDFKSGQYGIFLVGTTSLHLAQQPENTYLTNRWSVANPQPVRAEYVGDKQNVILSAWGDDEVLSGDGKDQINLGMGIDLANGGAGDDLFNLHGDQDNDGRFDHIQYSDSRTADGAQINWDWEAKDDGGIYESSAGGTLTALIRVNPPEGKSLSAAYNTTAFVTEYNKRAEAGRNRETETIDAQILHGGAGNDAIFSGYGNDALFGDEDNDIIGSGAGNDYLSGGTGNDKLFAGHGRDLLVGGQGDDTLWGEAGNDVLSGGADNDKLYGDAEYRSKAPELYGNDLLEGDAGEDTLVGGGGADTLFGGADKDLLIGDFFAVASSAVDGNDSLNGGAGNDTLMGRGGDDQLRGGDDDDLIYGEAGNDVLIGDKGNDSLDGGANNDVLEGGEGDDSLMGGSGNDTLRGGEGRDTLAGEAGSDHLYGETGDVLVGGADQDFFYVFKGDSVTVVDEGSEDSRIDIIPRAAVIARVSAHGVAANQTFIAPEVNLVWVDSPTEGMPDVYLDIDGTQIYFYSAHTRFESISMDGQVILGGEALKQFFREKIDSRTLVQGDEQANLLAGNVRSNRIFGAGGNDTVQAGEGDDYLSGGDGDDHLYGGAGRDFIRGDEGSDTLYGGAGSDTLVGAEGDVLLGGEDVDVYHVAEGSEVELLDTSNDAVLVVDGILDPDATEQPGVSLALIADAPAGSPNLRLSIGATSVLLNSDYLSINEVFYKGAPLVLYTDIKTYLAAESFRLLNPKGTNGPDTLTGSAIANVLYGLDGGDYIDGKAGDDVLQANSGNDTLIGGIGNDLLIGGLGDDTYVIRAGDGADEVIDQDGKNYISFGASISAESLQFSIDEETRQLKISYSGGEITLRDLGAHIAGLKFESGATLEIRDIAASAFSALVHKNGTEFADELIGNEFGNKLTGNAGNDVLFGLSGTDTIIGGAGADYLSGGLDTDTYIFGTGDGLDVIDDSSVDSIIQFNEGVNPNDVTVTKSNAIGGFDLVITYGNGDAITIRDGQLKTGLKVQFSNGQAWNFSDLELRFTSTISVEDDPFGQGVDYIFGTHGSDILVGEDGSDELYGKDGDDTLDGGAGDDILVGEAGLDTYVIRFGDGSDQIVDRGVNVIQLEGYLTKEDLYFFMDGSDLVIAQIESGDSVVIRDYAMDETRAWTLRSAAGEESTLESLIASQSQLSPESKAASDVAALRAIFLGKLKKQVETELRGEPDGVATNTSIGIGLVQTDELSVLLGNETDYQEQTVTETKTEYEVVSNETVVPGSIRVIRFIPQSQMPAGPVDPRRYRRAVREIDQPGNLDGGALGSISWGQGGTGYPTSGSGGQTAHYLVRYEPGYEEIEVTDPIVRTVRSAEPTTTTTEKVVSRNYDFTLFDARGGDGSQVMSAEGFGAIFGGAGNDQIGSVNRQLDDISEWHSSKLGIFAAGGLGNDLIIGTDSVDWLVADAGNDSLAGGGGADNYHVLAGATVTIFDGGIAVIPERAKITLGFDFAFRSVSYGDADKRGANFTGSLTLSGRELLSAVLAGSVSLTLDSVYWSSWYNGDYLKETKGLEYITVNFVKSENTYLAYARDINRFKDRLSGVGVEYTFEVHGVENPDESPLLQIPESIAKLLNSGRAQEAMASDDDFDRVLREVTGVATGIEADVLNFGSGITYQDLSFALGTVEVGETTYSALVITQPNGAIVNLVLPGAETPLGFGVEVIKFADGTEYSVNQIALGLQNAGGGNSGSGSNQAPVVSGTLPAETVQAEVAFSLVLPPTLFSDADASDVLTWSVSLPDGAALPSWLSFDPASYTLSGVPMNADVGELQVRITATDKAGAAVSTMLELNVLSMNHAPVVVTPLESSVATEGQPLSWAMPADWAVDADESDVLAYTATLADGSALPAWLSFDALSKTFTGLPGSTDLGDLTLRVTATDKGGLSVSSQFQLSIAASGPLSLTGTAEGDTLTGYSGDDVLDGAKGSDRLLGGLGDDTYLVDNVGDVVVENAGEGLDTVKSSIDFSLPDHVETLRLIGSVATRGTGNSLNNLLVGNALANSLTGGAGNDTLNGGVGADTMDGGEGDDSYYVDHVGDVIVEQTNAGKDTVRTSISYTLGTHLENLSLIGEEAIGGTGNALANLLIGNAAANTLTGLDGNDTLNGGAGADTLVGGLGDDLYIVDNSADQITELADEGVDWVRSTTSYVLGDQVEKLTLSGEDAINGTGNALDNTLTGNAAANVLTGGAGDDSLSGGEGADTLIGGIGDDVYTVDNAADVITELAGEGIDYVRASVSYVLSDNVERLGLLGEAAINATGNSLDNTLTGNVADNVLIGGAGKDVLTGGLGNDTLQGGTGDDTYRLYRGHGHDVIEDVDTLAGNKDWLRFIDVASTDVLAVERRGANLVIRYAESDQVTIKNYFDESAPLTYRIEQFRFSDGVTWTDAQIQAKVVTVAGLSVYLGDDDIEVLRSGSDAIAPPSKPAAAVAIASLADQYDLQQGQDWLSPIGRIPPKRELMPEAIPRIEIDHQLNALVDAMAQFSPTQVGIVDPRAAQAETSQAVLAVHAL